MKVTVKSVELSKSIVRQLDCLRLHQLPGAITLYGGFWNWKPVARIDSKTAGVAVSGSEVILVDTTIGGHILVDADVARAGFTTWSKEGERELAAAWKLGNLPKVVL